jgi:hypothetical protein
MVNNCSMTVNYCSILTLEIIVFFTVVIYHGKLISIFITLAPGPNVIKLFTFVVYPCFAKARVFVLKKPLQPSPKYMSKARRLS